MNISQEAADYFKFCPGEEHVKISHAICRGRRRANFPKCPGCQFNDDENAGATASAVAAPIVQLTELFRRNEILATTPQPLTTEAAWRIGHAAGQFLHGRLRGFERAGAGSRSVVVGRDARSSSTALQQSLVDGIRSVGLDVINIGVVDTPQIYFAVNHYQACGGIQTTGGIKPAQYNGFKLCGAKATPIGEDTGLASIRDIAMRVPRHQTGMAAKLREADLSAEYGSFVRNALPRGGIARPMRIVIDAANGVAGRVLPMVWSGVERIELEFINAEPTEPFAHDPDPCNPACTIELRKRIKETKANLGIAFSGDGERCTFFDERGMAVPGDIITAMMGRMLIERHRGAAVVLDVRASLAAAEEIQRAGGILIRERVGCNHLRKAMVDSGAIIGGDWSGRFYFREAQFCESAFLAASHLLSLLSTTDHSLGELVGLLRKYRSSGEVSYPCDQPDRALERVASLHGDGQIDHVDGLRVSYPDWWFNLRRLDDEASLGLVVEAKTKKLVDQHLDEIADAIAGEA